MINLLNYILYLIELMRDMPNKQFLPQQMEKNVIFVSDLPPNVIESDLWVFFEKFTDKIALLTLNPNKNPIDIYHTISAKIIFKDFEAADYARREMNLRKLKGRAVRIMWDERDNSIRYNSMTNLFVNSIPFSVKPREVYEYFLQFGDISSAKLNEDINGNHMGYGYVTYYSAESTHKAIMETDGKIVWGSKLEVKYFQKKTERMATFGQANTKIFVSNLPGNFSENELGELCSKFGEVYSVTKDKFDNAIVTFTNEESPLKAKVGLDKQNISGYTISIELYNSKSDKKSRMPLDKNSSHYQYQVNEMKTQLDQYRNCNLHVKNIPFHAKESDIKAAFSKYGDIRSVKIETYALMTKVNDEFKEVQTSKGFGYVCFEKEESASIALSEMNGKFLPGFETWKQPLLIEIFKTKTERNIINQVNPYQQPLQPGVSYYPVPIMPMGSMPPPRIQQQRPIKATPQVINQQKKIEPKLKANDLIDRDHFNSIDSIEEKKEYLGEIIFKKIEDHHLAQEKNMSIDTIGKITGMILNIDEIEEIIDICLNDNFLTFRIEEAWELLNK